MNNSVQMKLFILVFIQVFSFLYVFGQNQKLEFEYYNLEEGLSDRNVNSTCQDQTGFLWFATSNGLNKFDGYKFTTFFAKPGDHASLQESDISTLYIDSINQLWIGTPNTGLYLFNREKLSFAQYCNIENDASSLGNNKVSSILQDHQGRFWVTYWGGFALFNPNTGKFKNRSIEATLADTDGGSITITKIVEDKNGILWMSTFTGGLLRYDPSTDEIKRLTYENFKNNNPASNRIWAMHIDKDNVLWLGTWGGLIKYTIKNNTFKTFAHDNNNLHSLNQNEISSIAEDKGGFLWIGTMGGINVMDKANETFINDCSHPDKPNSLSNGIVISVFCDMNNGVWIGTDNGGLNYYSPFRNRFKTIKHVKDSLYGLSLNYVGQIYQKPDGIICVKDWNRFSTHDEKTKTFVNPENIKDIQSFAPLFSANEMVVNDNNGKIWFCNALKLTCYDPVTQKTTDYKPHGDLSHERITTIAVDRKNNIWMGDSCLICLSDKEKKFKRYKYNPKNPKGLALGNIQTIFADQNNTIWLGGDGLSSFDLQTEEFKRYTLTPLTDSLTGIAQINHICEDNANKLWLSTNKGLVVFDPSTRQTKLYTDKNGLPSNTIYKSVFDKSGNLWISSGFGITLFLINSGQFVNFTVNDGLQSNTFNPFAFIKSSSGIIYAGGMKGLNIIDPEKIKIDANISPVVITDIQILNSPLASVLAKTGKSYEDIRTITLKHDENSISIEFAMLNFNIPAKNEYTYILKGFGNNWNQVSHDRRATYTNLDPGKYVFVVKAANNDGKWNNTGTSLTIIILPPWWETWWFRILALTILSGSTILFIRYKTESERKQKEQLKEMVTLRTNQLNIQNEILKQQSLNLQKANDTLLQQSDELRKVIATKDKLFSIIAHDLKSPFSGILGLTELLHFEYDEYDESNKLQMIESIYSSTRSVYELLENLLQWSRCQRSSVKRKPMNGDMKEEIMRNQKLFASLLSNKNINLTLNLAENNQFYADKSMLDTVLRNLITNAIKFSNFSSEITISTEMFDGFIQTSIKDQGVGIDTERLSKLFNIDGADSTFGTNGEKGTGLGLIVCKEFIELHGGKLFVTSEKGKGSCFSFSLPSSEANAPII